MSDLDIPTSGELNDLLNSQYSFAKSLIEDNINFQSEEEQVALENKIQNFFKYYTLALISAGQFDRHDVENSVLESIGAFHIRKVRELVDQYTNGNGRSLRRIVDFLRASQVIIINEVYQDRKGFLDISIDRNFIPNNPQSYIEYLKGLFSPRDIFSIVNTFDGVTFKSTVELESYLQGSIAKYQLSATDNLNENDQSLGKANKVLSEAIIAIISGNLKES